MDLLLAGQGADVLPLLAASRSQRCLTCNAWRFALTAHHCPSDVIVVTASLQLLPSPVCWGLCLYSKAADAHAQTCLPCRHKRLPACEPGHDIIIMQGVIVSVVRCHSTLHLVCSQPLQRSATTTFIYVLVCQLLSTLHHTD